MLNLFIIIILHIIRKYNINKFIIFGKSIDLSDGF